MMTTPTERHLTYLYLLDNLVLGESLARQVAEAWYGYDRPEMSFEQGGRRYATDVFTRISLDLVRAAPSPVRNLIVCAAMKDRFQLEGVAGFFLDRGVWQLNLHPARDAIVRPYRDAGGLIQGLLVYSYLNDKKPRLLTSRFLPKGTKAEAYRPERISH